MGSNDDYFDLGELTDRQKEGERAGLTDADREYLSDPDLNLSESTERQRKYRIRKRIQKSLIDGIFLKNLPPEDIEQMFGRIFPKKLGEMEKEEALTVAGIRGYIHLFFLGMKHELFQYAVGGAIERALFRASVIGNDAVPVGVEARVDIRMEGVTPLDALQERFENGAPLTEEALEGLALDGRISWEDVSGYDNVTDDESVLPTTVPEEMLGRE